MKLILWPKMHKASISVDFDSKILPEATFFKLELSNFFLFISIMPLKTYFNEKFNFGDFDFSALLSGSPNIKRSWARWAVGLEKNFFNKKTLFLP